LLLLKVRSTENRAADAADPPPGLDLLRSGPVLHQPERRRHRSAPPPERRSHLPQRRHVRTRRRSVGQQNSSVQRNNNVEHKSRQREPPSNARRKTARHNSGAKRRNKPQEPHNRGRHRNRQGPRRSGLERNSERRNARVRSSSVERPNRNALARLNNSVTTSAGKQLKGNAQPSVRQPSADVPMNSVRWSEGGRPTAPTRRYAPEPISQSLRGTSSCGKNGRGYRVTNTFVCGRPSRQVASA
jgi:hypothetical protein